MKKIIRCVMLAFVMIFLLVSCKLNDFGDNEETAVAVGDELQVDTNDNNSHKQNKEEQTEEEVDSSKDQIEYESDSIEMPTGDNEESAEDKNVSMDESIKNHDVIPPLDSETDNIPTSSSHKKMSIAFSDDYVAFIDVQNQLKLYDWKNCKTINTNKTVKSISGSKKYIFYHMDDGIYEYKSDTKVCDLGFANESFDDDSVLFVGTNNTYFIWDGFKTTARGQIDVGNAVCFDYSLIDDVIYARFKDSNDGSYYIISIINGIQNRVKADDYAVSDNALYTLKDDKIYKDDTLILTDKNIASIHATDYGLFVLKNQDNALYMHLTYYDLNGNVIDEIQNVIDVKEYSQALGIRCDFENKHHAIAITKNGVKQYSIDEFFGYVLCNENYLILPSTKSFEIITFSDGKSSIVK